MANFVSSPVSVDTPIVTLAIDNVDPHANTFKQYQKQVEEVLCVTKCGYVILVFTIKKMLIHIHHLEQIDNTCSAVGKKPPCKNKSKVFH